MGQSGGKWTAGNGQNKNYLLNRKKRTNGRNKMEFFPLKIDSFEWMERGKILGSNPMKK
jgi:hypothetical protein